MKCVPFKEIAIKYKAIFFDAYGVLRNQDGLVTGIENTLSFLNDNNILCYILTNDASKSPALLAQFYQNKGITSINKHSVISSGTLAGNYLKKCLPKGGNVVYMGSEDAAYYLKEAGFQPIPISHYNLNVPSYLDAFAILDDKGVDLSKQLNKAINLLRTFDVPLVLANPDLIYPVSDHKVSIAAGGIAASLELITGKEFIKFGKPDRSIFQYAFDRINLTQSVAKNEILMVGDTLETDIVGGRIFGIDTALVLSGNTRNDMLQGMMRQKSIEPNFLCNSVFIDS